MPDFGAGAWINGLFHVEQLNGDCLIPDDLRGFVKWKNMWRIGTLRVIERPGCCSPDYETARLVRSTQLL